jgi:CheY-like chemotaxis protein
MIFDAAQRGALLSGQLLTFSRKGMAKNERTTLQVNGVIRNLYKMLGRVFPKNILIQMQLADDLRLIRGSADQLNQVLMNLAVNASHAMAEGGTLKLETANVQLDAVYSRVHPDVQPGEFILVVISDTGHGMDWQTQQRIFEPFFTTKKVGEGTGLGLSVAYGIIKDHGGHIVCETKLGEGTTFKIFLPSQTAAAAAAIAEPKASLAQKGGNETILIVDDEAPIRSLLQRSLTKLGYTIISAPDGEGALLRFHEAKDLIRLVVMDLGMPGMGGWECMKQLRVCNPKLPILLATGYGGPDLQERAKEEGAVRLINKPYQLEELFRNIREALDQVNATPG